jgi:hypothetical protein
MPPVDRRESPELDWSAVTWSGVAAGAVFMILEMLLVPMLLGGSPWLPVRWSAAVVLGPGVLPSPDAFAPGVFAVGMAVHFALSLAYTALLARITRRLSASGATVAGIAFGFALYVVNFHLLAMAFPWVATARSLLGAFAHVAFGAVAAFTYHAMTHERPGERPIFDMRPRAPTI